ncbi:uncharacterized protein LOC112049975 isoform X2 [Bicyclus anynana]|uniref:Uncharacterized protein LOC112049975 isoform X2 n=1 Tax=Bicyclus anynana TaxID=110368 RepID=A0ABM3M066_BICAN|nr:uncharacterized protein LOC112049975 isoform X2 [Bicyclus anynana]
MLVLRAGSRRWQRAGAGRRRRRRVGAICLRGRSPRAEPSAAARAPYIQFTAALLPAVYFGAQYCDRCGALSAGRCAPTACGARPASSMERRRRLDPPDPMTKPRRREKPRERWLLTRKTWRYMADAGRRLVPDGGRADDVPRLEAYFQEVCSREPRFLLLRKSSYPGVLPKPRRKKRARGGSVRARSPPLEPPPARPADLRLHTSGGRFDIAKLRREFFAAPPPPSPSAGASSAVHSAFPAFSAFVPGPRPTAADDVDGTLLDLLRKHLTLNEAPSARPCESDELLQALRSYLKRQAERAPADSDADPAQRILRENLGRYYQRSSARDNTVQDLLNDKSLLKKLYNDLRKTKPYRGGRGAGGGGSAGPGGFGPGVGFAGTSRSVFRGRIVGVSEFTDEEYGRSPPMSPPPLIEVAGESAEERLADAGTQTMPIREEELQELERAYREQLDAETPVLPASPPPERRPRRRSSVDHDDVSQSVSDTIKRYLRMARKKSVDSDKSDRFKRINYDKNLRNIKPRPPGAVDDDGLNKGVQTDDAWILSYRERSMASTPTSPPSPSQSHSFLSSLLGRGPTVTMPVPTGGMQKSRSSSSVVQSVSKRLWRTRSRSSSRVAAAWTPQGSCCWADGSGRCVRLADTSLLSLTEVERRALQQAALARLQQLNLGTTIKIPEDNAATVAPKPKRRAYLLKRKALTTGFFDQSRAKDGDKEKEPMGNVFGVPLSQCVEAERALRRHGGSRASLASLNALEKADDSESCDSGEWGWSGLEDGGSGPKVPSIVSACLTHLRRHALHTLGLFRVSSSKKRVRQLREEWERGQETALDAAVSPHDVAALLKEFLRDLPDPLLCKDLYPAFLQTQKIRNRHLQWEALQLIVQLLPAAHRDTLNALLSFLAQLAANADDDREPGNRMTAANLATIFAPNILHRNNPNEPASPEQLLSERADVINVVRQLVERHSELWALPAEQLHQAYIHLAQSAPTHLDSLLLRRAESAAEANANAEGAKRLWSRESFLHAAANTATLASSPNASRVRSSEERGSSGIGISSPPRDSAPDSNDSASDYNETGNASEDDCVITASLHIPAIRPRRRSTSGSSSSAKRDSAVGSSAASPSPASSASPPASPPPRPERPERRHADIERLVAFGRERNTSDARAVVVKQHDETTVTRTRVSSRQEHTVRREDIHNLRREDNPRRDEHAIRREDIHNIRREDNPRRDEHNIRREDPIPRRIENATHKREDHSTRIEHTIRANDQNVRRDDHNVRRDDHNVRREDQTVRREERREGTMLYKRGELISSAQTRPT